MLEVHPSPSVALCDSRHSLSFAEFDHLLDDLDQFLSCPVN